MSTFDGIVKEFPNIRIDYFRHHPGKSPPAACFLSHIHSDHLLGLETLKMPFVYCSAATRRLLLRMEKYPHRINFSKGILESRKQTYKHLKLVLRALPLHTPIELELGPKSRIQVTLFDANHCPGAVMFLIEGDGHTILYTGDIRAESWWVNSLVRHPILIPFAIGLKRLDCMYLDTTFASHQDIYREFPSKAEGLAELIKKIKQCPNDSIFYFRAWTLGYEDVWITLRDIIGSQIHVDQYHIQLFCSVAEDCINADPGPALIGFSLGHRRLPGCLTEEQNVRIHSCEPGMACHRALSKSKNVVWITPIISRLGDGTEVAELGAGGGVGDLYQRQEVNFGSQSVLEGLRLLCSTMANDTEAVKQLETVLRRARDQDACRLVLDGLGLDPEQEITIERFVKILSENKDLPSPTLPQPQESKLDKTKVIHFPYSRHSSYFELRELVRAFLPKDICPCTVNIELWTEELSMESLFGDVCSGTEFRYDELIRQEAIRRKESATTATEEQFSQQLFQTQSTETQDKDQHYEILDIAEDLGPTGTTTTTEGATITDHELKVLKVRDAWRALNNGSDTFISSSNKEPQMQGEASSQDFDDISDMPSSISDTLPSPAQKRQKTADQGAISNLDGAADEDVDDLSLCNKQSSIGLEKRRKAYKAAKACLNGDVEQWQDLHVRSMGWMGHTEEENEL